jgi:lysozyme family protein
VTEASIIDAIIEREIRRTPAGVVSYTNDPADKGGATNWGITAKTLGIYRALGRPATRGEVKALTRAEAADIYRQIFIKQPGFAAIAFEPLRVQLIDFGVNSGPARAVRWLQRVCRYRPVDGRMTPALVAYVNALPGWLVNDGLVAARLFMIDKTSDAPDQKRFEEGWENRALEFFLGRAEPGEGVATT